MNFENVFENDWSDDIKQFENDFETTIDPATEFLLVSDDSGSYEGNVGIIVRLNGELYEVQGGHCSCYGYEGQWTPDRVTLESLRMRKGFHNLGEERWAKFIAHLEAL